MFKSSSNLFGSSAHRESEREEGTTLADGLQRCGLGARILRHAIAHAGHPVAGRAVAVTLPASVGLRVPVAEPLESSSDLRLAADRRKNQHTLASVYQVGEVPDVLGPADRP